MHFVLTRLPHLSSLALAALSLFASKTTLAQTSSQLVEITGKPQSIRERQDDIGMRAVYGRDEIEKYGDTNVSDILKRLPGISVSESKGKGAEIRMRGLGNGYTQILLNGQATPVGFTIDSIAPELIEKIEVIRVASADLSAQSIAGTINITLKKKSSKQASEFKSNASVQAGRLAGNLSWSIADQLPTEAEVSYVLAGNIESSTNDVNTLLAENNSTVQPGTGQWQTLADRQLQQTQQNRKDAISLSPRLNWKLGTQDSLSWQGNVNFSRLEQAKHEKESSYLVETTDFPINNSIWSAHILTARNDISWERRLADSAKLTVNLGWNRLDRDTKFQFWGRDNNASLNEVHYVTGVALENEYRLLGKYLAPYSANHVVSLGWEASRAIRDENRIEHDISLAPTQAGNLSSDDSHAYQARLSKFAAYVQDEWSISKAWSVYLGLRWERIASASQELGAFDVDNVSTMASPILQTVWKTDEQSQWRFALNRSFKIPSIAQLVPRRFRIDNNNTPLNADFQGNPQLRPERAWGLELAHEHYFSANSLLSTNLYWRQIDDVIMEQLSQANGSWLTTPINNGRAKVIGLEIEAKAKLHELSTSLPDMELRATINRNWSKLNHVPGPDNRLSQQTPLLISTGADYQLQANLRIGADYSFQAASNLRESAYLSGYTGPRRHLDVYLAWRQNHNSQLRFSVSNVLQQDKLENNSYTTPDMHWMEIDKQESVRTWRMVWECKL